LLYFPIPCVLSAILERLPMARIARYVVPDLPHHATCLMPNHLHLILVPDREETHRRYSSVVNARLRVTGHLFQSRFGSVVMDEEHLVAAARYVALNPVRGRLVARAQDWRWSSVTVHLDGRDDALVAVAPLIERSGGQRSRILHGRLFSDAPHGGSPERTADGSRMWANSTDFC
jgi:hypothetical protein